LLSAKARAKGKSLYANVLILYIKIKIKNNFAKGEVLKGGFNCFKSVPKKIILLIQWLESHSSKVHVLVQLRKRIKK
jgi:tRNA splicing ligase